MATRNKEPRTVSARLWPTDVDTLLLLREMMERSAGGRPVSIADVISRLLETHRSLRNSGIVSKDGAVIAAKILAERP